jgi:hypothetical protein
MEMKKLNGTHNISAITVVGRGFRNANQPCIVGSAISLA